jgi:hypothetical protein
MELWLRCDWSAIGMTAEVSHHIIIIPKGRREEETCPYLVM